MEFKPRTDYLFSKTGFMIGLGSVINLAGNYYLYNGSKTADEADRRALANDWAMVAEDLRDAAKVVMGDDATQMLLPLA